MSKALDDIVEKHVAGHCPRDWCYSDRDDARRAARAACREVLEMAAEGWYAAGRVNCADYIRALLDDAPASEPQPAPACAKKVHVHGLGDRPCFPSRCARPAGHKGQCVAEAFVPAPVDPWRVLLEGERERWVALARTAKGAHAAVVASVGIEMLDDLLAKGPKP